MLLPSSSSASASKGHSFKKTVEDHMSSPLQFLNKQSLFVSQSIDYGQQIACNSYPYNDSGSGIWAAYGSHTSTVVQPHGGSVAGTGRVPLPLELAGDELIYVNPKQYRGILRRRQLRAKLEAQNKIAKVRKPYLHESRHLHAMKRVRGSGGRFINTKELQQQQQHSARPSKDSTNSSDPTYLRLGGGSSSAPKIMISQEKSKKAYSSAPGLQFQFPGQHLSFSDYFGQLASSAQAVGPVLHNGPTQQKVPVMR